ncbi:MAG: cobalt-precorrin 5A hydrolase [Desulfobacterales bacterium]
MNPRLAIWTITPGGFLLGGRIALELRDAELFVGAGIETAGRACRRFHRLSDALEAAFTQYPAHLFIMAAGIVVRAIAPFLGDKTRDPAVVVMDERGLHVVSLLSGHVGGANRLARELARRFGAEPVITTATDLNGLPAIDELAVRKGLRIANPGAIRNVSMALLKGQTVWLHDPYGVFEHELPEFVRVDARPPGTACGFEPAEHGAGVVVDDIRFDLPPEILLLRPGSLVAGMGCNRNTGADEMAALLDATLETHGLAKESIAAIATVDIKADEPGLLELGARLNVPVLFFTREELETVQGVVSASAAVRHHIGVGSVCEAAAILGAKSGKLVVTKQKTPSATLALARKPSTSSASVPAAFSTFRSGPGTS